MSTEGHAVSRRTLLRGAGLLGLGGLVSGCGSAFASGVGRHRATEEHAVVLEPVRWRRRYPHGGDAAGLPEAASECSPGCCNADLGQSLLHEALAGHARNRPPDVGISHLSRAPILADAGLLEPLNETELAPHGLIGRNFTPAAWQKAHMNGTLYAVPLDTHPFVLYYNTHICKKAGLLNADGSLKISGQPGGADGRPSRPRRRSPEPTAPSPASTTMRLPSGGSFPRCTTSSAAACSPTTDRKSCSTTQRRKRCCR